MRHIVCSKEYARCVMLDGSPDRNVYKHKIDRKRWVKVNSITELDTEQEPYIYSVNALLESKDAQKMLLLTTQIEALNEELSKYKRMLNTDAAAYRSNKPHSTYVVSHDNVKLSSLLSNSVKWFGDSKLFASQEKAVLKEIFDIDPTTYTVKPSLKQAVVHALNNELLECLPNDYLEGLCGTSVIVSTDMSNSAKTNAHMFMDRMSVDWDTAYEWAKDYELCKEYEQLCRLASRIKITYDELITKLAKVIEIASSNRVIITMNSEE